MKNTYSFTAPKISKTKRSILKTTKAPHQDTGDFFLYNTSDDEQEAMEILGSNIQSSLQSNYIKEYE